MPRGDLCIDVEDPDGYRVTCTRDFYLGKVVRDHTDFAGLEASVARAIEAPNCICSDADFPDRRCYYLARGYRNRYYIKAVVVVEGDKRGRLISAHPRESIPADEHVLRVRS